MLKKTTYNLNKNLIKENSKEVLFISNYESNVEKNISHFFYNKTFLKTNTSFKKQIKAILKAKYVYIDEYIEAIDYLDRDKCIIYTPRYIFNYMETLNEKEINQFQKYTFITSSSKTMTELLINKYNVEKEKILEIGCPFVDYMYTHKFLEEVEGVFRRYPEALTEYNILYNPSNISSDVEKEITFINYVTSKLPDNYQLYTTIDLKYTDRLGNAIIIDQDEIKYFTKLSNLIITDYDNSLFEATYFEKNIILYQYNQKVIQDLKMANIEEIDLPCDVYTDKEEVVKAILNQNFKNDNKKFNKKYNQFNKGTSSRDVVVNTFEEYKGE